MINQVVLMGRLTRDPETKYYNDYSVTRISLAVDRDYKGQNEDRPKTDFINCMAWNKTGEFIEKYFKKGSMIAVMGSIETGSYTAQDGSKVYTTVVRINKVSFTGEKRETAPREPQYNDGFMNIPDGVEDEGLPFN